MSARPSVRERLLPRVRAAMAALAAAGGHVTGSPPTRPEELRRVHTSAGMRAGGTWRWGVTSAYVGSTETMADLADAPRWDVVFVEAASTWEVAPYTDGVARLAPARGVYCVHLHGRARWFDAAGHEVSA